MRQQGKRKKGTTTIIKRATKQRTISDDSQATVAAGEITAVPPLPSHHSKQQHSKQHQRSRQLPEASTSETKTNSTSISTGNRNSAHIFHFLFCRLGPPFHEHSSRRVLLLFAAAPSVRATPRRRAPLRARPAPDA